jgi:hypothetical protein
MTPGSCVRQNAGRRNAGTGCQIPNGNLRLQGTAWHALADTVAPECPSCQVPLRTLPVLQPGLKRLTVHVKRIPRTLVRAEPSIGVRILTKASPSRKRRSACIPKAASGYGQCRATQRHPNVLVLWLPGTGVRVAFDVARALMLFNALKSLYCTTCSSSAARRQPALCSSWRTTLPDQSW